VSTDFVQESVHTFVHESVHTFVVLGELQEAINIAEAKINFFILFYFKF